MTVPILIGVGVYCLLVIGACAFMHSAARGWRDL